MARVPVECPCGGTDSEKVSEKDGYEAVRCLRCGIVRTSEREENYQTLYTEGDRYHVQEMDKIGRDHYSGRFDHDFDIAWQKRIPKLLSRCRTLDVGCANGAFVSAMSMQGFAAEGIEINPGMAQNAAAEIGCPVWTSWDQVKGKFDIITYLDVFEHIVDPKAELVVIRDHLAAGGLLVLDCPDGAEVFGPDARASRHEKPAQHLFYYTESTMRSLLAACGFIVLDVDRPLVGKIVAYARKNGE